MLRIPGPIREILPDVALAAAGIAALTVAGTSLGLPVTWYVALVTTAVGLVWLARRYVGPRSQTALEAVVTGIAVYATGWGPALALVFAVPLVLALGRRGSPGVPAAVTSSLVAIAAGQVATAVGLAPSVLTPAVGHGVAAAGAAALVAVARRMHRITQEREAAQRSLQRNGERYRVLVQHATDIVVVLDEQGRIVEQGPSVTAGLGHDVSAFDGALYTQLVHAEDAPAVTEAIFELVAGRTPPPTDARLLRSDGSYVTVEIAWSDLRGHPAVGALVAHARDVSDRRTLEAELEHRAYHDSLTGLANREKFIDRLEHTVARSGRRPQRFAVLFVDLDGFKDVNDTLGHEAGDRVLVEVAHRIDAVTRVVDTPARFGGDEFAILLDDLRGDVDAVRVTERLLEAIRAPIDLDGQPIHVDGSVGIAVSTGRESADELLRSADAAMYGAKHAGKGRYEVFEATTHVEAVARLDLEHELSSAIANGGLELRFEPVVTLEDEHVTGFEALVRWRHPDRGLLEPHDFLPMARETGLIVPLGRWVLTTACRTVAAWQQRYSIGREPLNLRVNVSAPELLAGDLVADVARALAGSGLDPQTLILEVAAEALAEDHDATVHMLRELKYVGVQLALDGFGDGPTPIASLPQLPFDELKVARSLTEGLGDAGHDETLLRAVLDVGRSLRTRTVVRGVTSDEQALRAHQLRFARAQGPLFGGPATADDAERGLALTTRSVFDELIGAP